MPDLSSALSRSKSALRRRAYRTGFAAVLCFASLGVAAVLTGCGSSISPVVSTTTTPTSITLSASPAAIDSSGSTTLTVTVTNSEGSSFVGPTGTVTFNGNSGAMLGTATLTENTNAISATATLSVPAGSLATGTNTITATYAGDSFHVTSVSNAVTVTVGGSGTTTGGTATTANVSSSVNSVSASGSFSLTASIAAASGSTAPTGNVVFVDSTTGVTLGTGVLVSSNGTAATATIAVPGSSLQAGANLITAQYQGSSTFAASSSASITVTQTSTSTGTTATTTALIVSYPSVASNGTESFVVTVSQANTSSASYPTGTVEIVDTSDNNAVIGTLTLHSETFGAGAGNVTISASSLPTGANVVVAEYLGDSTYAASSSPSSTFTVTGTTTGTVASTASIEASSASIAPSGAVTLTATISQANTSSTTVPTGQVSFVDLSNGNKVIGTATLSSSGTGSSTASASVSGTSLVSGNNLIEVTYAGDTNFAASTSSSTTVTVTGGTSTGTTPTTTKLTVTPTTVTSTGTLSLTAVISQTDTMTSTYPTGTVYFVDTTNNNTVVATATTFSETFGAAEATTTVTAAGLPTGANAIVAEYAGDSTFVASSSASVTVTVSASMTTGNTPTTTTVSANPTTVSSTDTVSLNASVSENNTGATVYPSGTVQFVDTSNDNAVIATAVVSSGTAGVSNAYATVNASVLVSGVNAIVAQYLGDSTFAPSTSPSASVTVSGSTTPTGNSTTTTFTLNPANIAYGGETTLNIVVTGAELASPNTAPSGAVTIYVNGAAIGTASIGGYGGKSNSSYMIYSTQYSSLGGAGTYNVYVTYPGDGNYAASTSTTQTVTVTGQKATPAVVLSFPATGNGGMPTTSETITFGTCAAVTATLTEVATPGGTVPTGSIEYYTNGNTPLGSGNLNGSTTADTATFQVCTGSGSVISMKGTYTISATYAGDGNYAEAPSSTDVVLTVQ